MDQEGQNAWSETSNLMYRVTLQLQVKLNWLVRPFLLLQKEYGTGIQIWNHSVRKSSWKVIIILSAHSICLINASYCFLYCRKDLHYISQFMMTSMKIKTLYSCSRSKVNLGWRAAYTNIRQSHILNSFITKQYLWKVHF